eukprot:410506-Rhodomonas_salina.1
MAIPLCRRSFWTNFDMQTVMCMGPSDPRLRSLTHIIAWDRQTNFAVGAIADDTRTLEAFMSACAPGRRGSRDEDEVDDEKECDVGGDVCDGWSFQWCCCWDMLSCVVVSCLLLSLLHFTILIAAANSELTVF